MKQRCEDEMKCSWVVVVLLFVNCQCSVSARLVLLFII